MQQRERKSQVKDKKKKKKKRERLGGNKQLLLYKNESDTENGSQMSLKATSQFFLSPAQDFVHRPEAQWEVSSLQIHSPLPSK